ncbi:MAG: DUF1318 domain-containing protein [Deltaproteobacteria bacterium]|nr:DUF1318 domain-containing protein [Deltaproteobacteria bacterium]
MSPMRSAILFLAGLSAWGCVKARINVVDERTALENQILGSYEELDQDLQLVASVRAVDESGDRKEMPRFSEIRKQAIQARQTQQFQLDDIEELKAAGCLGEAYDGKLAARDCPQRSEPTVQARIERLIEAENAAREVLLQFVVTTSPDLTQDDAAQVRSAYARMNRERARPGQWIQSSDGSWARKPED